MTLPELATQYVYARVAWGIVLAALLVTAWRCRGEVSLPELGVITLLAMGSMWLPGAASPAFWFGLAFQQPSVLLAALSAVSLHRPAHSPGSALAPAAPWLAVLGAVLYTDAAGWTRFEWYAFGADARIAPLAALLLGGAALAAVRTPALQRTAWALLVAVFGFCTLRLPSGNLLDALLDPLLWLICVWLALRTVWRRLRRKAAPATQAA